MKTVQLTAKEWPLFKILANINSIFFTYNVKKGQISVSATISSLEKLGY